VTPLPVTSTTLARAIVAPPASAIRRACVVRSDETTVRVDGRTCWHWVFRNNEVVIHVIRHGRGAGVVREVMAGHRPALWISDLSSAQQGRAAGWQIGLAHQLRGCQFAIEAGDTIFAPRMKMLLLRAFALARRRHHLAESTRRQYRQRLDRDLDAIMALIPTTTDACRLRTRYGKLRAHLFTFLDHPEVSADNNSSERELRPTATDWKVTGGFRSKWGGGSVRRLPIRRRDRQPKGHRSVSRHQNDLAGDIRARTGVSRYIRAVGPAIRFSLLCYS
jgi:transposase